MPALAEMKRQGKPITALTAYDYATARLVDEAAIDVVLVGDSLAMVVLGHENTLAVTVEEMLHHTRAVRRAVRRALVVADMPFGSYHGTIAEGLCNAIRFVKEGGSHRGRGFSCGAPGADAAERAPHGRLPRAGSQRGDGAATGSRRARAGRGRSRRDCA
jgi:3-methyl-2-oxobutanoate hydroxymethyltransferase